VGRYRAKLYQPLIIMVLKIGEMPPLLYKRLTSDSDSATINRYIGGTPTEYPTPVTRLEVLRTEIRERTQMVESTDGI